MQQSGIKGELLNWVNEYLSQSNFKLFFECEYSSERPITSVVPQGSTLSPTLFNIMVNDLPCTPGIRMSEYADDITFYCTGECFNELKALAQKQMDNNLKQTKTWGLKIFTNKRMRDPSCITLLDQPIKYAKSYKYLGMILDAPNLKSEYVVDHIRNASLSRINIQKTISTKQ